MTTAKKIKKVPHGGYTMSVLYRLAITHFKHTHPTRHSSQARPIAMQMNFLRRTAVGPVTLTVQDSKLGLRTSTIHVTLSQADGGGSGGGSKSGANKEKTARVVGYITMSDPVSEVGHSYPSSWQLRPPRAPEPGPPKVVITLDDVKLAPQDNTNDAEDSAATTSEKNPPKWRQTGPTKWSKFRTVEKQCITFSPTNEYKSAGALDQWARLRTVSSTTGKKEHGRWTNDTLGFLSDWLPVGLEEIGIKALESAQSKSSLSSSSSSSSASASKKPEVPPFWFPTVALNVDFKKSLPAEGVEWIYSRVVIKSVQNGRMDIEAILMDEQGDIVALCSHVGLVVDIARNTSGRKLKTAGTEKL